MRLTCVVKDFPLDGSIARLLNVPLKGQEKYCVPGRMTSAAFAGLRETRRVLSKYRMTASSRITACTVYGVMLCGSGSGPGKLRMSTTTALPLQLTTLVHAARSEA